MKFKTVACFFVLATFVGCGGDEATGFVCEGDSTYELVQQVFDTNGCNASDCHGAAASEAKGLLDLRNGNSHENLINVDGFAGEFKRVFPGDEDLSLLYLKLAAKTKGTDLQPLNIAGGSMPASGPAVTEEQLELVRAWIRGGAPETSIVSGAETSVGCSELGPADPNKIPPLEAPDAVEGIQFYSGAWSLPAESENEVCFVNYYDYTDSVPNEQKIPCPEEYGGPTRECFTYKNFLLAQDPQSHHSIIESYVAHPDKPGQWDPLNTEYWKNWQCTGGANDGMDCNPTVANECGDRAMCTTRPATSIACILYSNGPEELGVIAGFFGDAAERKGLAVGQEQTYREELTTGVYGIMPVKGFVVWNSHAFNLTTKDTTIEQWINMEYSTEAERIYQRQDLVVFDNIFGMGTLAPFEKKEVCATFTLPRYGALLLLSSHTHQRGSNFRIWYPPNAECHPPGCVPPARTPDYISQLYNDPLYQRFNDETKTIYNQPDPQDRTFAYCADYDNGATNPTQVRRESERPDAQTCAFAAAAGGFIQACGCDPEDRACLGGPNQGMICNGDDSVCGQGGVCDACPLAGGVTTEEEMFAILGAYYIALPNPLQTSAE